MKSKPTKRTEKDRGLYSYTLIVLVLVFTHLIKHIRNITRCGGAFADTYDEEKARADDDWYGSGWGEHETYDDSSSFWYESARQTCQCLLRREINNPNRNFDRPL